MRPVAPSVSPPVPTDPRAATDRVRPPDAASDARGRPADARAAQVSGAWAPAPAEARAPALPAPLAPFGIPPLDTARAGDLDRPRSPVADPAPRGGLGPLLDALDPMPGRKLDLRR